MEGKKLYRSAINRKISGVCGGIGEYIGIDPTIVRVIWVLFSLLYGVGIIAYIVLIFVIPDEEDILLEAEFYQKIKEERERKAKEEGEDK